MLQNIDLSRTIDKASFKAQKTEEDLKLGDLQRTAKSLEIPTVILFEGWSASGKGTLINELILPLDPRGFTVHSASGPTEEETFYPFLWRFLEGTPTARGVGILRRRVSSPRENAPGRGRGTGRHKPQA